MAFLNTGSLLAKGIAIDPGTNHLGLSVILVYEAGRLFIPFTITLEGMQLARQYPGIMDIHGEKIAKLYGMEKYLEELFEEWMPDFIVSESPYMGRFPRAYAALVECITAIRRAVIAYDRNTPLHQIDPASVKQAVGVNGRSGDKALMRKAIELYVHPTNLGPGVSLDLMDEHCIDSLAVGIAFCKNNQLL